MEIEGLNEVKLISNWQCDFERFLKTLFQMTLDSSNVQHEKLVIRLVQPIIPEFSVPSAEKNKSVENGAVDGSKSTKRSAIGNDSNSSGHKKSKND